MLDKTIYVTKPYLPENEKYKGYVDKILDSGWLTNNASFVQELERRLSKYLGVKNVVLVANGSLALQISYKILGLTGEVITTPFTFVATASTMVWEGLHPLFSDIDSYSFNLDPECIESRITNNTSAIVPVHVYGNPCQLEEIESIANRYNLKIIYDAAHAFGVKYKNKSVLNYGDISTISFHSTKMFHTIEGGAVITNNDELAKKARLLINFGITGEETVEQVGINAKMNEFQAAMGLCVLDDIEIIKSERKKIWEVYYNELSELVVFQDFNEFSSNNHSYVPILFENEKVLLEVLNTLRSNNIIPRRYFYPTLDNQEIFKNKNKNPVANDISKRILCLPIYPGLTEKEQDKIIKIIKDCL